MSGGDTLIGVAVLKTKILNIEKNMRFFIIDKKDMKYDLVLGLDSITAFKLSLNEKLILSQNNSEIKISQQISNDKNFQINWNEFIPIEEFEIRTNHLDENKKNKSTTSSINTVIVSPKIGTISVMFVITKRK